MKASTVRGGAGNDVILAAITASSSTVYGDLGADSIQVGATTAAVSNIGLYGDNTTSSEGGNDTLTLNAGTLLSKATVSGGVGADTIGLATTGAASEMISSTVNGNAGNDSISVNAAGSMISSSVFGGQGNDSIALTSADSGSIYGDNGADSIDGDFTSALVYGDNAGQSGADTFGLDTTSSSTVYGGGGNDTFFSGSNALTSSSLYGGSGTDTFSGSGAVTNSRVAGEGGKLLCLYRNPHQPTILGEMELTLSELLPSPVLQSLVVVETIRSPLTQLHQPLPSSDLAGADTISQSAVVATNGGIGATIAVSATYGGTMSSFSRTSLPSVVVTLTLTSGNHRWPWPVHLHHCPQASIDSLADSSGLVDNVSGKGFGPSLFLCSIIRFWVFHVTRL